MDAPRRPRGRPPVQTPEGAALRSAVLSAPGESSTALAATLGVTPQRVRQIRAEGTRTIAVRVTLDEYRALEDYADRAGCELVDAIRDNLLGRCWSCGGVAILDARERPLCERCRERTGMDEALSDDEERRRAEG